MTSQLEKNVKTALTRKVRSKAAGFTESYQDALLRQLTHFCSWIEPHVERRGRNYCRLTDLLSDWREYERQGRMCSTGFKAKLDIRTGVLELYQDDKCLAIFELSRSPLFGYVIA